MPSLPSNIRWEVDPGRPMRTGFHVDHERGELTIVHLEDVEFVLQKNQDLLNATDSFSRRRESWHMWARIPPGIIMKWKHELGVDLMKSEDWPKVQALLHDKDWSKLRTSSGNYMSRPRRDYHHTQARRAASLMGTGGRTAKARGGI